jgi:hypothetical protein
VTAKDQFANLIQGATVVLAANPTTGNTLTQPAGTTNSSGIATGTLSSTKAEAKTVSATINGVAVNQTAGVTVTPAAADHLTFTVQPANSQAAPQTLNAITIEVRDAFDNLVTNATDQVTLAITNGTGTGGAVLGGTNPKAAAGGIVTFSDLTIDLPGNGYTLDASAAGLTGATSNQFNITP